LLGLLIAMFGPGNKDLKYPKSKTTNARSAGGRLIREFLGSNLMR